MPVANSPQKWSALSGAGRSLECCAELLFRDESVQALSFFPVTQDKHSRQAVDAEAISYRRALVNVHAVHGYTAGKVSGNALQARFKRSTGWASGLVEIKHNRSASLKNLGGKLRRPKQLNRCHAFLV